MMILINLVVMALLAVTVWLALAPRYSKGYEPVNRDALAAMIVARKDLEEKVAAHGSRSILSFR